ncbi:hypothetical protein AAZV13_03G091100 [Glycine max]
MIKMNFDTVFLNIFLTHIKCMTSRTETLLPLATSFYNSFQYRNFPKEFFILNFHISTYKFLSKIHQKVSPVTVLLILVLACFLSLLSYNIDVILIPSKYLILIQKFPLL